MKLCQIFLLLIVIITGCNVVDETGISPGFFQSGASTPPVFSFKAPVTSFYSIPDNSQSMTSIPGKIQDISIDSYGNVFLATDRGLAISQDNGSTWVLRNKSNGFATSYVHRIHVHSSGRVFFIGGVDASSNGYDFIGYFDNDPTSYTQLTTTDGLENNRAHELYEASSGRFFIFGPLGISMTTDGGASFTAINTSTGLATNSTNDIYSTGNNVYVCGFGGVSISTDGGASFNGYTTSDGLGASRSNYIFADSSGTIYASHNYDSAGVSVSNDNGASWTVRTTANGLTSNNARGIFEPISNKTVVGFTSGVPTETNDNGTSFSAYTTNDRCWEFFKFGSVIFCGANNNFEVSTDNGASYTQDISGLFSSGSIKVIKKDDNTYFSINNLGMTRLNSSLVKTDIAASNTTAMSTVNDVKIFSDDAVIYSYGNSLYYSTDGGKTFVERNTANGLSGPMRRMFIDSSDNLYVGGGSGLFYSTDRGITFTQKTTADGLPNNTVNSVFVDSAGNWYVATQGGLGISTNGGTSFISRTTAQGLGDNAVTDVAVDSSGRVFTTHSAAVGISISTDSGTTFTTRTTANGLGSNNTTEVFIDSSGNVYVGTQGGMSTSTDNGATFTNISTGQGLTASRIEDILVNSSGEIYVANTFAVSGALSKSTDSGVSYSTFASTTQGLPSNVVYEVEFDSNGYAYVLTNSGLATNRPF